MSDIKFIKTAIVLGGTNDHISLIIKLKERGYYVCLLDYLENPPAARVANKHLRISTLNLDDVERVVLEIKPKLVISVCIDQALLTMANIAEKYNLPTYISYDLSKKVTNKRWMKKALCDGEVLTSRYIYFNPSNGDLRKEIEQNFLSFPLVIKPADSNSSKGIRKVKDYNNLKTGISKALQFTRNNEIIIEEYVEGQELTIDVWIEDSKAEIVMISEVEKVKETDNYFTILRNVYNHETHSLNQALNISATKVAQSIVDIFKINNGPLLMQVILKNSELNVIEFGCRIGGGSKIHLLRHLMGVDLIDRVLDLLLDTNLAVTHQTEKIKKHGAMFYLYCRKGQIANYDGFDEAKRSGIIDDFFFYKLPGEIINNHRTSSDRPAGILISGVTRREIQKKLVEALKIIEVNDSDGNNLIINELYID